MDWVTRYIGGRRVERLEYRTMNSAYERHLWHGLEWPLDRRRLEIYAIVGKDVENDGLLDGDNTSAARAGQRLGHGCFLCRRTFLRSVFLSFCFFLFLSFFLPSFLSFFLSCVSRPTYFEFDITVLAL